MLYIEWDENIEPSNRKASVSFYAKRSNIIRPEFIEKGNIPDEVKKYLTATGTVPITGAVKDKAEEITSGKTTTLDKVRAIYDWIIANINIDNEVRGCGTGEFEKLLTVLSGKCTDINSVFIGLTRAVGIPSREMFGIRINADYITGNQHCWSEFYLPGTGWVAADPADVLKAVLSYKYLDKSQKETLELQEFYFGSNDEKRIELSSGRDIILDSKQSCPALNNFGYPYAEIDDEVIDCWDPKQFVYNISFKKDVHSLQLNKNRVYVKARYVKSVIDNEQPESNNYVVAYVNYGGEPDDNYNKGHIPGAIVVGDVDVEDATGSKEGAYNLLSAEKMEKIVLSRGIDKDTTVILYGDDVNGVARVAYGYLWLGIENVKILNGGFKSWENEKLPTETTINIKKAKDNFGSKTPVHPEYWMSITDAVEKVKNDSNFKLVSALSYDEFVGDTSGYNYMDKAGEPLGAVWAKSAKTATDVAYICNDDNTVKELSGMKKVWNDAENDFDVDKNDMAFYCGTGWRACPPFLCMCQEGYKNMTVYDGGWYEYLFKEDLPVQVGDPQKGNIEKTKVKNLPTGKAAK